jgi:hypothetical protein
VFCTDKLVPAGEDRSAVEGQLKLSGDQLSSDLRALAYTSATPARAIAVAAAKEGLQDPSLDPSLLQQAAPVVRLQSCLRKTRAVLIELAGNRWVTGLLRYRCT